MIGKKVIFPILFLLILVSVSQALEISASVDRQQVEVGGQITLQVVISGKGGTLPKPTLPDLSAFDIYSAGQSQNISIVNGAFTSSLNMTYMLVPKRIGEFIIGPIIVRDGSGMATTEPIKIIVSASGTGQSSQPPSQGTRQPVSPPQAQRSQPPDKGGDLFIDQVIDKTNPYVGEQVILTFRFYQAVNLWDQPALEWPKYSGVTVEDLVANHRYYEVVRGRRYLVTEIKRALFPISSGRITIDTPTLTIKPDNFGVSFDPFGFFDKDLRELFRRGQPKVLTANAITLNVKPLPEKGKPADFTGAVGKYSFQVSADKDSVGVDEPITLKLVLDGTGNIRSIAPPKLPDLPDFRIYDSGNTESISNADLKISGTKTFEQAVIPKTSGNYIIPAISFSYFDPSRGEYKTITASPIQIAATGEGLVDVGGAPKNVIGSNAKTLGYLVTEFPKNKKPVDLSRNFFFWLLQFVPIGAIAAALIYKSKAKRMLTDLGYARRTGAGRRLKSVIKKADDLKKRGDMVGYYGALHDAVLGLAADKLNLEKSGLTTDHICANESIPSDIRAGLAKFLESCQTARFAPGGATMNHADKMMAQTMELVSRMEKEL